MPWPLQGTSRGVSWVRGCSGRQSTIHTRQQCVQTPPLGAVRVLCSFALSVGAPSHFHAKDFLWSWLSHIYRTHQHIEMKRTFHTDLQEEHLGRLLRHLYNVRDASQNVESKVEQTCVAGSAEWRMHYFCAFKSGSKAPHPFSFVHHGDDFLIVGTRVYVKKVTAQINLAFIVKTRGTLGSRHDHFQSISCLLV